MHATLAKALKEALDDFESIGDKAVRKHLMGMDEREEGEEPVGELEVTVEKIGKPKLEVVEGLDGEPALDETEATPEEEEISGELLEKLKEALSR